MSRAGELRQHSLAGWRAAALRECDKCNKEFNQKSNYVTHINRKISCSNNISIEDKYNNIEQKYQELEQKYNTVINKNILLENENNKLNENIYR